MSKDSDSARIALARLRSLLKHATPGRRFLNERYRENRSGSRTVTFDVLADPVPPETLRSLVVRRVTGEADAALIAACSPPVIAALLAVAEAALDGGCGTCRLCHMADRHHAKCPFTQLGAIHAWAILRNVNVPRDAAGVRALARAAGGLDGE